LPTTNIFCPLLGVQPSPTKKELERSEG
jgi:hypothetical protein